LKHDPYGKIQGKEPTVQGFGPSKRRVKPLTRSPASGSRKSGLRFGDMEGDSIAGYGAGHVKRSIITERTDEYVGEYCMECGSNVKIRYIDRRPVCLACGNDRKDRIGAHSRSFVVNTGNTHLLSAGILNKTYFEVAE